MNTVSLEKQPPPKTKTFEINHGGDVKKFPYVPVEHVERVIVEAIARFHLTAQPHQLGLFKAEHTEPLEPSKTLEQAGVRPGERLTLRPIVVQGG